MKLPISKLVNNNGQIEGVPKNPRFIKSESYDLLVSSLKDDPDFLNHKPLHVYPMGDKYVVLGGNQRLRGLKELGYKEVPVTIYKDDTPVEVLKARIIKDNNEFGENDMDLLANEWSELSLKEFGVDMPSWQSDESVNTNKEIDPEGLLGENCVQCPKCKFEFEP
jgi:ParB-like chromosome segregation protein Spo0J